jgi:hypothetical protein
VRALLVEVAGVRLPAGATAEEETSHEREALDRARRRALVVAVLDAAAIALLVLLRQSDRFLVLGRNEETLFTLGVLVVAVHLGFRLAQGMTIGTVRRLHEELVEREE